MIALSTNRNKCQYFGTANGRVAHTKGRSALFDGPLNPATLSPQHSETRVIKNSIVKADGDGILDDSG